MVLGPKHTFSGIVTLEDLLEEFVGEIRDEQDYEEIPPMVIRPDGSFEVDGRVTLDVAARDLGIAFTPEAPEIETIAGYVEATLQDRPVPGDCIELDGFRLTILAVRDGRIRRLEGERLPAPPEEITPGV